MSAKNCHSLTKIVTPSHPASWESIPHYETCPLHPGQQGTKCESFSVNPGGWGFFEVGLAGDPIAKEILS